jgi:hypothetical protein
VAVEDAEGEVLAADASGPGAEGDVDGGFVHFEIGVFVPEGPLLEQEDDVAADRFGELDSETELSGGQARSLAASELPSLNSTSAAAASTSSRPEMVIRSVIFSARPAAFFSAKVW